MDLLDRTGIILDAAEDARAESAFPLRLTSGIGSRPQTDEQGRESWQRTLDEISGVAG